MGKYRQQETEDRSGKSRRSDVPHSRRRVLSPDRGQRRYGCSDLIKYPGLLYTMIADLKTIQTSLVHKIEELNKMLQHIKSKQTDSNWLRAPDQNISDIKEAADILAKMVYYKGMKTTMMYNIRINAIEVENRINRTLDDIDLSAA